MKKLLTAIAVGTAMTVPQMPALADCVHGAPDVHLAECVDDVDGPSVGGCGFAAATDSVAGQGQMTGEIDVEAVVYSAANLADNPMSATFTCYIRVNGAAQAGAVVTASGTVVVAGGGVITYTSNSVSDFVQLCQDVSYSNGQGSSECFEADTFEIPPPIVWEIVDPIVCEVLKLLTPGEGPVFINAEGDVWINGEGSFDCPPYGNVFGFPPNPDPAGPRARGHATIHRFPDATGAIGGAKLYAAPVAQNGTPWACRDINSGATVVQGDLLDSPDPGVECTPPAPFTNACVRVDAGGYHADAGSGTVEVRSACGALAASATIQVPSSWPGYSLPQSGFGVTPWRCTVDESLANAAETDYWVFCHVNLP